MPRTTRSSARRLASSSSSVKEQEAASAAASSPSTKDKKLVEEKKIQKNKKTPPQQPRVPSRQASTTTSKKRATRRSPGSDADPSAAAVAKHPASAAAARRTSKRLRSFLASPSQEDTKEEKKVHQEEPTQVSLPKISRRMKSPSPEEDPVPAKLGDESPPHSPPPAEEETHGVVKPLSLLTITVPKSPLLVRLLSALQEANDLPSAYAALKFTRHELSRLIEESKNQGNSNGNDNDEIQNENEGTNEFVVSLTLSEQKLIDQAELAIPYLMCKYAIELCTLPRSLGGLAFSTAKATKLCVTLFEMPNPSATDGSTAGGDNSIGFGLCSCPDNDASSSEQALSNLSSNDVKATDLRKILPKLKEVGIKARSKVDEFRETVVDRVQVNPDHIDNGGEGKQGEEISLWATV